MTQSAASADAVATAASTDGREARRPLDGITVVEIGTSVAAPYACLVLADLGARIVKVENPDGGDYARGWGPPFWGDTSSTFVALNRGKQSVTLDLASPDGNAALRALIVDEADVVVQNLRPGLLEKFGFDVDALRREKPSLIWCDIGAFGTRGPLREKPGYDPLAQATAGIMSVTGEPARPPVRVGVSLVDMGSGMWSVIGVLAQLLERERTGAGGRIQTSLFETALAWMTIPLANYEASGEVLPPQGSGTQQIVPYQAFRARDAWLMIAAGNDNLFRKLCRVLDRPDLAENDVYATNAGRVRSRDALIATLQQTIATFDAQPLAERLDAAGVPNAPLLGVEDVPTHPQTVALQMRAPCDGDTLPLMGIPLSFDGLRPRSTARSPSLGEHNATWIDQDAIRESTHED
ncbi:CaiB/BaiF CoA transferase family protein [Paraburkholderia caballeronis]|uniref:CaiB/BaiF CoA transferase family protein n=1 Tax=Paraburkholderia caballeronis TaxID=416943 RepID=UPI001066B9E7|nr:CoA transferase [Paraburkholderia caballeronis]TDV04370.1 crotonobetainyl-CoA:carnitine CoA-transferase CaiB-like acyl-CoA transferase [Paraburkholderia caballeronis]TDV17728.1 crotonobetainyl-CoA:carnitine CoA-transferase CaiB-like acyl-CoA transferase [Paraburkholderia caballeronis]TDV18758.1 crotonobetainyl-CoA:carnitine CoA-transferase CaiB-like acyl-CoA transferase [Paraburkholderia caballeronis]